MKNDQDIGVHYYEKGGIATIDVVKAKLTREQYQGFLLGNIIKYSCRVMHKHDYDLERIRDLEKARAYIDWLIEAYRQG